MWLVVSMYPCVSVQMAGLKTKNIRVAFSTDTYDPVQKVSFICLRYDLLFFFCIYSGVLFQEPYVQLY